MTPRRGVLLALAVVVSVGCRKDAHCADGAKSGTESDVDCGGACRPCDDGSACRSDRDCQRVCIQGVCMTAPPAAEARPVEGPGDDAGAAIGSKPPDAGARQATLTWTLPVEVVMDEAEVYNGVDPAIGRRFWRDWRLVTTRYRQDSRELRFIYANELAWKTMVSGGTRYPDGAVIAKVGSMTEPDPLFPNSLVPAGASRVQFMVKDAKRYAATDGWGYALYPPSVRQSPDEKEVVDGCHACHRLAAPLDFIFVRPAFLAAVASPRARTFKEQFDLTPVAQLSAREKQLLDLAAPMFQGASVRRLRMGLFAGSLNESIMPVSQYVAEDRVPYLMVDGIGAYALAGGLAAPTPDCRAPVLLAAEHPQGSTGPGPGGASRWMFCPPAAELPRSAAGAADAGP